jgi:hypothetical protein
LYGFAEVPGTIPKQAGICMSFYLPQNPMIYFTHKISKAYNSYVYTSASTLGIFFTPIGTVEFWKSLLSYMCNKVRLKTVMEPSKGAEVTHHSEEPQASEQEHIVTVSVVPSEQKAR